MLLAINTVKTSDVSLKPTPEFIEVDQIWFDDEDNTVVIVHGDDTYCTPMTLEQWTNTFNHMRHQFSSERHTFYDATLWKAFAMYPDREDYDTDEEYDEEVVAFVDTINALRNS